MDATTQFSIITFLKEKSNTFNMYYQYESQLQTQYGKKIKCICFDSGKEFLNNKMINHLWNHGTLYNTTAPHSSAQNGITECLNHTLLDHTQSMIFNTDLPKSLWPHAISYSCHIKNHSLTHTLKGSTPFEKLYRKKPDLSSIRTFGCDVWVLNQGAKGKLNPRSNKYIFIGLSDDTHTYWYYRPGNSEVAKSQNVIFPCSTNSSISIPFPSQPEGENGHRNLQAAQETLDGEVDLIPKDQAVNSTNAELIPSNQT